MNYRKCYEAICKRGSARFDGVCHSGAKKAIPFYVERHRIIPGCMGGKYVEGNVAWLTPEEHFVAHQLLTRMYPDNIKLWFSLRMMCISPTAENCRMNNKMFGWIKRNFSKANSEMLIERHRKITHPMSGKHHSEFTLAKIRIGTKKGLRTSNWVKAIHLYSMDGYYHSSYETIQDAADYLHTNASNVKYTAEGKFTHCKHMRVSYIKQDKIECKQLPKKIWITNGLEEKKISFSDVVPDNYYRGRNSLKANRIKP